MTLIRVEKMGRFYTRVAMRRLASLVAGLVLALAVSAGAGGSLRAQTGSIGGRVVDAVTRSPIAGVEITLPDLGVGTLSSTDGTFALPRVAPGAHTITASLTGYEAATREITLAPGDMMDLRVALSRDAVELARITVIGERSGYSTSAAATKIDAPLTEIPQAVTVITREQMDLQRVRSVPEALRYASGVIGEQRGVNTGGLEYVYGRGFQIDEYLNGLRLPNAGAGFNIVSVDARLVDRLELVHGPASVLYGEASPGGLINLSSKRPTAVPSHRVDLQTGNRRQAQAAVDLSGPLVGGDLAYRFVAGGSRADTQVETVERERIFGAASLSWSPTAATDLVLSFTYQRDPKAGFYNLMPAAVMLPSNDPTIPRELNPGDPTFDRFRKTAYWLGYSLAHRFGPNLSFNQNFRWLDSDQYIQGVFADDGLSEDGGKLGRYSFYNDGKLDDIAIDNQLHLGFRQGPLDHSIVIGADFQRTNYWHVFEGNFSTPGLDIRDPQYGNIPFPDFRFATSGDDRSEQLGVYVQDHIRAGPLALLAGVRKDWTDERSRSLKFDDEVDERSDDAFTGRVGASLLLGGGLAPYLSYSTSFQPVLGSDFDGNPFENTTGQQLEAGIKYAPQLRPLFISLAAFQVTKQNVETADPDNAFWTIQTGEIRSRGLEAEARLDVANRFMLIGAYTLTDVSNTRSTTHVDKVPVGISKHMGSVWAQVNLGFAALRLSGGLRYVGSSWGDADNTLDVPAYTLLDAGLRFVPGEIGVGPDGWEIGVAVTNLLDRTYVSQCVGVNDCSYGLARSVQLYAKYAW